MRSFFQPASGPSWLGQVLNSIRAALSDIWPTPLRLKDYATVDLPTAADFGQGLAYNLTNLRVTYSNGSAWVDLMPYTAGAALTKTNDTNVTLVLGGTPATALLAATSLTLGWTGQLSTARGGTGNDGTIQTYVVVATAGSGTFTTVSTIGRYLQIGKLVWVWVQITVTTNGTAGTYVQFNAPVTAKNNGTSAYHPLTGRENAVTGAALNAAVTPGGTGTFIQRYDAAYPAADGYVLVVSGWYEAA